MVNAGHPNLAPLLEFRNWLSAIRDDARFRCKKRRNGEVGPGPFTMHARKEILLRLRKTEEQSPWKLLSRAEDGCIKRHWERETP
jgi:DNA sulfur modification protein DndC